MIAQIVVKTNAHPYSAQLVAFWFSLGPIVLIIAFIAITQYVRIRRNRQSKP